MRLARRLELISLTPAQGQKLHAPAWMRADHRVCAGLPIGVDRMQRNFEPTRRQSMVSLRRNLARGQEPANEMVRRVDHPRWDDSTSIVRRPLLPERSSGNMKSVRRWARAAWARYIAHTTLVWTAKSRSKSY